MMKQILTRTTSKTMYALPPVRTILVKIQIHIKKVLGSEELNIVWKLRRVLHALEPQAALELLLEKMKGTKSNVEFLMQIQKTTSGPDDSK